MRRLLLVALAALAVVSCSSAGDFRRWSSKDFSKKPSRNEAKVTAFFNKDCEKAVIAEASRAEKEILIAVFSITRRAIANALVAAIGSGVKVTVKYDVGQANYKPMQNLIDMMAEKGVKCIPVKMSGNNVYMHNKFMVVDCQRVLTGSYNFTTAGMSNYENLVVLESEALARRYVDAFENIKDR